MSASLLRQIASFRLVRRFAPASLLVCASILVGATVFPVSSFAQSPSAGQHVQFEGVIQVRYQDFKDHAVTDYFLTLPNGKQVQLQFSGEAPEKFLTGDHVVANGMLSGSTLLLSPNNLNANTTTTSSTTTSTAPLTSTTGPQSTLVILVNFQDNAVQPYTVADAQNMYSGQVNSFFSENSYGQTSIVPTVVGWFTIPESVTTCNVSQIATDAQNAAIAAGVNLSNYTRYVYAFPTNNSCGWAGSSYVGGSPSQSWIADSNLDVHVIDHELGHAFGLWHSHALDCGLTATICSPGTVVEYGDILDTMGRVQTASPQYNAFQKERLGWLNNGISPTITTVQTSGTYTINPYEIGGSGPNALKILKSTDPTTGAKTWYYLEARQAIGFDAFLANSIYYTQNETTGVLFHIGTDGNGNGNGQLDMTPATPTSGGWYDASLAVGQSFTDSTAGVTITTQSAGSGGAVVNVQLSNSNPPPPPPPPSAGALTIATNQASYSSGQTVSIAATATNGGTPVANVAVSFVVTKANGSKVTGSATTGTNGIAVYNYKLKRSDSRGTYVAGASAQGLSATSQFTVQ